MADHKQQLKTLNALVRRDPTDLVVRSNEDADRTIHLTPTLESSAQWQFLYSTFNTLLFGGALPECMIVYTRRKHCFGYFAPNRFCSLKGEQVPELGLNPTYLRTFGDLEACKTLAHEQAHVARYYFGPRGKDGAPTGSAYHDRAWGAIMEGIGLMPSNSGQPGGKKTGYQMMEYIIEGGPFEQVCRELFGRGFKLNWGDNITELTGDAIGNPPPDSPSATGHDNPGKKDRIKFTCPECGQNAWAKPAAKLACASCGQLLVPFRGKSS